MEWCFGGCFCVVVCFYEYVCIVSVSYCGVFFSWWLLDGCFVVHCG